MLPDHTGTRFVMSAVALVVDARSLKRTDRGTISGVVYAQLDKLSFPERNWTDLVVRVLVGWLDTISKLARGASWEERFYFLDGPFAIEFTLNQNGAVQVRSIESRLAGDFVAGEYQTDLDTLLTNARSVADDVLAECFRLGWTNPSLESLAEVRRELDTRRRSSA